jgi:hypothetical protein
MRPPRQGLALPCGPSTSPLDAVSLLRTFLVICLFGVAGCIPAWPQVTPSVTGRVQLHESPVSGADVYLVSLNLKCGESSLHAVTSSDGTFSVAGTHRFQWIIPGDYFSR